MILALAEKDYRIFCLRNLAGIMPRYFVFTRVNYVVMASVPSKRAEKGILSEDFRKLIIRRLIDLGGNSDLITVPRGSYAAVAKQCGIHKSTVKSLWMKFCVTKCVKPAPKRSGKKPKLQPDEMELIDFLVVEKPSISLGDIKEKLLTHCNKTVSKPTICRYLRKRRTRKLLVRPAADRFRADNLRYMQVFIDVLGNGSFRP